MKVTNKQNMGLSVFILYLMAFIIAVAPQLRDMQIKLLRKTRKTVHEKSWETALSKFCFAYSAQDAWEVERFGYKNAGIKVKLRILRVYKLLKVQQECGMTIISF